MRHRKERVGRGKWDKLNGTYRTDNSYDARQHVVARTVGNAGRLSAGR